MIPRKRVHTIPAFFYTETDGMLKTLEDMGIDVTECFVCKTPIVKTERTPLYLRERWDAWRHGKKFHTGIYRGYIIGELSVIAWHASGSPLIGRVMYDAKTETS